MEQRIDYRKVAGDGIRALLGLETYPTRCTSTYGRNSPSGNWPI